MVSWDETRRQLEQAVEHVKSHVSLTPSVGIILGTGLGTLVDGMDLAATVDYAAIPNFPVSTVESHAGRLLFGTLSGKPVVCMQGRFHSYEGHSFQQVVFPVRVMKLLGIESLIVSNASGGLNPNFVPGDVMLMKDHINFLGGNPLIGPNFDDWGPRFPDMYDVYCAEYRDLARKTALEMGIALQEGVYVAVPGPNLETAAEYRMLRIIGADAVGMSTVPEVIAARHQGTKVLGFSIITDMGLPDALQPCSITEVLKNAAIAEPNLRKLIAECVGRL
jgi:purine-nucleoside phosphorylase